MFNELVNEISKDIQKHEQRSRLRTTEEQSRFEYAVKYIVTDLWKACYSIPVRECSINLRSGYYSENPRYRDPQLTFRQIKAVYDALIVMHQIEVTRDGYYDKIKMEGSLTCFVARDELLERLKNLEGHPAISLKPDLDRECIVLRNTIDGRRQLIEYEETAQTDKYRSNLQKINTCFSKHWADLRIKDSEITILESRLNAHEDKFPIDLSSRTLTRIFSNGSFKEGGRFYRGWWQNVTREYRKHITLDGKKTAEYDFSQLNPHMIYFAYNKEMGSDDAYDRVLDGEHRDIVKQAFNAMIQAESPLNQKPRDINLDGLEMDWRDLRQRILDAHKPIQHLFFSGIGNRLQFEDSCIAESVMLWFQKMDAPALPVHDSFIMHHAYGGELEEAMRRAFYERFNSDIPIKEEILEALPALPYEEQPDNLSVEDIIKGEVEYSQWQDRDRMWWANKK